MEQLFSCFSYAHVDQQENIDITSDTPQQNDDCPKEIFIPSKQMISYVDNRTDEDTHNGLNTEEDGRIDCFEQNSSMNS